MQIKDHIIFAIGRFNPPTAGHHEMVQQVQKLASEHGADHVIFGTQSHGDMKNPLPPDLKAKHMKTVLGTDKVFVDPSVNSPGEALRHLANLGYKKITLVAGGKRAEEFEKFRKYFGKITPSRTDALDPTKALDLRSISPDNFKIHGIERDADSDSGGTEIEGRMIEPRSGKMLLPFVSASRMRANVGKNVDTFMSMLPSHVTREQARQLQNDLKMHLGKLQEEVSALTRLKLARAAKRTTQRRKITRRNRAKRRRSLTQLKVRAKNEIISQLRKKVYRGNWKKLSYSQRVNIDRNISKRKKLVNSMVKRIMPQVIQGETQRLRALNSSFDPSIMNNFFNNYLTEAPAKGSRKSRTSKESNRQPVDHDQKERRRRQNTQNQRNSRGNHKQAVRAGDLKGRVYVVKNKKGEIEIVDKKSLRKDHEIVVDAKDANRANVRSFLNEPSFVNTKTSIELFGKQEKNAGSSKTKGERPEEKKEKKEKKGETEKKQKEQEVAMQPPMIPPSKKASKKDTFATSHDATAMETGIAFAVNSMLGLSPEQMVEKGLIDKRDLDAVMANQHQSFMPSCQRAAQQIVKQFGGLYIKHSGRLKKTTKLSDEAKENGVVDNTPKSDLLLVDKDGKVVAGLSQKIGESQLSSGGPAETVTNLKWAMMTVGDKLQPSTKKQIEKFIKFFESELSGNPRTKQGPVSIYQQDGARSGEDKEVARREKLHEQATNMLNEVLNGDKKFAAAFIYSLITGAGKFKEGDPATATHILSANRDGTDLKMTQVDMKYAEKLLDKVKFQMKFKSSAVETTDIRKKWDEFKERKKKLGQKISIEEDFRPYSFRSVIRAYLSEKINYSISRVLGILFEKKESNTLKEITPADPQTPEEAVQYLKDAFDYIGDDFFKLYQFFEDTTEADTTQPIVDWTQLATSNSVATNKIFINGKEFEIPVEEPYNYTPDGNMESPLSENYLTEKKKRDYKSEYENYHSKPEQRANRSKRVLARRLMMKLGKVRKGDGKDVDHKDGDPQNNGKHNLRVRDKSANRADN